MRFLVFGTGAVGAYLGGTLALSNFPVVFLARPHIARAFSQQGLRLVSANTYKRLPPQPAESSPSQAFRSLKPEVVLLTVKAYDVATAARMIKANTHGRVPVVCFTNGIGSEATLSERLGARNVIPATLTTAVQMVATHEIRIERLRGVGLGGSHPLLREINQAFLAAGFQSDCYHDPDAMKWSKLLTNIVGNATSAIINWPPGAVAAHDGLFRLELESLREAVRVIRAQGLRPVNLPGVPAALLSHVLFLPPRLIQRPLTKLVIGGRGDKLPSFHYDIGRGQSEVDWLNGAVVRYGTRYDIPTPANRVLTDVLTSLVADRQAAARFNGQPEALLSLASQYGVPGI